MRKRLYGVRLAVLTAAVMACAVVGVGSAGAKSASKASGTTTLKLVVADYGTGPSNTSKKYWQGIVNSFEKANPSIKVAITDISWTNFDTEVQTMVQNKNYPDITEGDYFSAYAQQGLLYTARQVLSKPKNLLPVFASQGTYNGKQYGMPWTTSSRTLFYNKKLFKQAGIKSSPGTWAAVKADAAKIKAQGQDRLRPAAGTRRGAGRVAAVVPRRRRQLHEGQDLDDQQLRERHGVQLPQRHGRGRRHRAQPGHGRPHAAVGEVRGR